MLNKIIALDKQLFVFINGLGSEAYDGYWLLITKQVYWTPLFLLILFILQKRIGWKQTGIVILFLAFLILLSDQVANLFKNSVQRLRPCNDPEIKGFIRIVKDSKSFSFFSGHAINSMASTVFVFLLFKEHFKYPYLLFIFPLIFAYSRIYLGLHFPLDILTGYVFGMLFGFLLYKVHQYLQPKYFEIS